MWVKIEPILSGPVIDQNDFRLEIIETLKRDGKIVYQVFAADQQDSAGRIQWEPVGTVTFHQYRVSSGVDQNLLFAHDSLNSKMTGQKFSIPKPSKQLDSVPDDVQ